MLQFTSGGEAVADAMQSRRTSRDRAFTLVELLVVIGIIAVLIGVLLPVLSGVAARGRDLKCQANLRSVIQAIHGYAAENKGTMPWGFVWNRMGSGHWGQSLENNGEYLTWASLIGRHMNVRGSPIVDQSGANFSAVFSPALQCPEAEQSRPHVVSYAINYIVGVTPWFENVDEHYGSQDRPPRQTQLLKETALIWDTGVLADHLTDPRFRIGHDIDGGRFAAGEITPQFRYYSIRDPFAHIPPGVYGQNKPVLLNVAQRTFYNREPGSIAAEGGVPYPYQGNLRFRHQKNRTCNVAFSDGSVRQFSAKVESNLTIKPGNHDALRRYFMIKWPTSVQPNPGVPH